MSKHKLRILVICGRYGLSGVPLAQQRLAQLLADRGHNVTYMPLFANISLPSSSFNNYKTVVPGIDSVFKAIPFLIFYLASNRFDIVFSAGDHLNSVVLLSLVFSLSNSKVCCSSRVTPFDTYHDYKKIFSPAWFIYWLIRLLSWRCTIFSCVSKDMSSQYKTFFPQLNFTPIYNPLHVDTRWRTQNNDWSNPFNPNCIPLLAVGSLEKWKGFDTLIKAVSYLPNPNKFHLIIVGDGSERASLSNLIDHLHLNKHVTLWGSSRVIVPFYSFADIFILSSRVEGMPNVLLEALAHECSVVSTDCPTGPSELLSSGAGILVPVDDPQAMASAIQVLVTTPISAKKRMDALAPFSPSLLFKLYSELLSEPML